MNEQETRNGLDRMAIGLAAAIVAVVIASGLALVRDTLDESQRRARARRVYDSVPVAIGGQIDHTVISDPEFDAVDRREDSPSAAISPAAGNVVGDGFAPLTGEQARLIRAIAMVESSGRENPRPGKHGEIGILQIKPIAVREVNRILKKRGERIRYTLADRWVPARAVEIFRITMDYWVPDWDSEAVARKWNSGSNTDAYWAKVRAQLDALKGGA